jgi:membrane-associated phospholipid phosphatase
MNARGLLCGCSILTATFISVPVPALAQSIATPPLSPPAAVTGLADSVSSSRSSLSMPSLSQLFTSTVTDVRQLPSRGTIVWLGVGAAASIVAHASDTRISNGFSGSNQETFESGATIGGMPLQIGGALATYTLGRLTNSTGIARVGADLFRAQLLSQVMTQAIKVTARRTRPDGSSLSFPSGHTAATFASATVLQRHFGWKAGVPAYAVAAFVATSRVEEQKHYLSDVAFGAVLGVVAGRSVTVGRGDARFAVVPAATNGGGAVAFTWVGRK